LISTVRPSECPRSDRGLHGKDIQANFWFVERLGSSSLPEGLRVREIVEYQRGELFEIRDRDHFEKEGAKVATGRLERGE
jgi:hypothetical protein